MTRPVVGPDSARDNGRAVPAFMAKPDAPPDLCGWWEPGNFPGCGYCVPAPPEIPYNTFLVAAASVTAGVRLVERTGELMRGVLPRKACSMIGFRHPAVLQTFATPHHEFKAAAIMDAVTMRPHIGAMRFRQKTPTVLDLFVIRIPASAPLPSISTRNPVRHGVLPCLGREQEPGQ